MSALSDSLISEVDSTISAVWETRDGQVVPNSEDLKLGNDRVELEAVLLYADLADSTELAIKNQQIAAEIFKSYLHGVTKIIQANGGQVRSFDGDRVMGVFLGTAKNTSAAKCGLKINWYFRNVIASKFKSFYKDQLGDFNLNQTVGIDASKIHVARAGVRNNNDLIWVGRAPNVAAKLSAIRDEKHNTFITAKVHDVMLEDAKLGGKPPRNMWTLLNWNSGAIYGVPQIYGSSWTWNP